MPILSWNDSYSVKNREIDSQHKKLFELINSLFDAMSQGKGMDILGTTLDALVDYAKVHFAAEEKLMAANKYPDLAAHKIEHEAFVTQASDLQRKYKIRKDVLTIEVMKFLKDWLTNHIMKKDQNYTPYINKA